MWSAYSVLAVGAYVISTNEHGDNFPVIVEIDTLEDIRGKVLCLICSLLT